MRRALSVCVVLAACGDDAPALDPLPPIVSAGPLTFDTLVAPSRVKSTSAPGPFCHGQSTTRPASSGDEEVALRAFSVIADVQADGKPLTVSAPLERMPLWQRAGSIIPTFAAYADTLLPATAAGVTSYADLAASCVRATRHAWQAS
ncbi:MAG: hypothetical protein SFX73_40845 [Kofleriaceae bacterium]|nr:hypothetical protein [Kofleriaceae bacterium]